MHANKIGRFDESACKRYCNATSLRVANAIPVKKTRHGCVLIAPDFPSIWVIPGDIVYTHVEKSKPGLHRPTSTTHPSFGSVKCLSKLASRLQG